ncbi:hypothetical protein BX600DRAFT_442513 [Xylariales sp. PMI_506]|nr:hypothetical protein BX600DRAFT_442513 [Xylariales sp. PMI_506]
MIFFILLELAVFGICVFGGGVWLDDKAMNEYINEGGSSLAYLFAPVWGFTVNIGKPMCYPTWAFGDQASQHNPDTYEPKRRTKTPGQPRCSYPDAGCHCRNSYRFEGKGPQFPIYYTLATCSAKEVRVSYFLFYEKDGFIYGGHDYDWENVVASITRNESGIWTATTLWFGGHGEWYSRPWDTIYTISEEDIVKADVNISLPLKIANQQHPFVFPGWAKHANFDLPVDRSESQFWDDIFRTRPKFIHQWSEEDLRTAVLYKYADDNSVVSDLAQHFCDAMRRQDVWGFADKTNFIRADRSTLAGLAISRESWGMATGTPPSIHHGRGLCNIRGPDWCIGDSYWWPDEKYVAFIGRHLNIQLPLRRYTVPVLRYYHIRWQQIFSPNALAVRARTDPSAANFYIANMFSWIIFLLTSLGAIAFSGLIVWNLPTNISEMLIGLSLEWLMTLYIDYLVICLLLLVTVGFMIIMVALFHDGSGDSNPQRDRQLRRSHNSSVSWKGDASQIAGDRDSNPRRDHRYQHSHNSTASQIIQGNPTIVFRFYIL